MLPEFPNFKKLEFADRKNIEKLTSKYPAYSDFDFVNAWAWNENNEVEFCILNDNLILISRNCATNKLVCSFLGNNKVNETLEQIFKYTQNHKTIEDVGLIPELSLEGIDLNCYKIKYDRDTSDYVYKFKDLAEYKGQKYASKRNLLNIFLEKHKDLSMEPLDLTNEVIMRLIGQLNMQWLHHKENPELIEILEKEIVALEKLLKDAPKNIIGLGVFVDNKLIGYCILSLTTNKYAVGLFSKYNVAYKGLNEYLMNKSAEWLLKLGYEYLNAEEDLGIPGLRFSKNSFRPALMLKKYSVFKK